MSPLCCQSTFAHQHNRAHTPHILTQSLPARPHVGKPVGKISAGCPHLYAEQQTQTKTLLPPLLQQPTRQLCCNTATAARRLHQCSLRAPTAYLQLAIHKGFLETFIPGRSYSPWQRQALPDRTHTMRLRGQQRHCSSALPCTHPPLLLARKSGVGSCCCSNLHGRAGCCCGRHVSRVSHGGVGLGRVLLSCRAQPHNSIIAQHSRRACQHTLQSSVSPCPLNPWRHARAY